MTCGSTQPRTTRSYAEKSCGGNAHESFMNVSLFSVLKGPYMSGSPRQWPSSWLKLPVAPA